MRVSSNKNVSFEYVESVRKARTSWRQWSLQDDINYGVKWCNVIFYARKTLQIHVHVSICDIVQPLVGFLQCNGGKLEEAEYFKCVFSVNCVLESK